MQECKNARMQECKNARMQECKDVISCVLKKSEKHSDAESYVNISTFWIFYFKKVIVILHHVHIRHEMITLTSISFGLLSSYVLYHATTFSCLLLAAIFLHFKDLFDACDGALARLNNNGHKLGRFLDSIGDFITISVFVMTVCIASVTRSAVFSHLQNDFVRLYGMPVVMGIGVLVLLSIFLQCSYFNYYQLQYTQRCQNDRLRSKIPEQLMPEDYHQFTHRSYRYMLILLFGLYQVIYAWQDKFIQRLDRFLFSFSGCQNEATWYQNKLFLTLNTALCFGTHIFVLLVFTLLSSPLLGLFFIITVMNGYWLGLILLRILKCRVKEP